MFKRGIPVVILSWSLMPGMLCVLSMREGLVVTKTFSMFLPLWIPVQLGDGGSL